MFCSFFFMLPPPLISTLFPYTTLFRSEFGSLLGNPGGDYSRATFVWTTAGPGAVVGYAKGCDVCPPEPPVVPPTIDASGRSEEHTSELQSRFDLVCRLLLEKKKYKNKT